MQELIILLYNKNYNTYNYIMKKLILLLIIGCFSGCCLQSYPKTYITEGIKEHNFSSPSGSEDQLSFY